MMEMNKVQLEALMNFVEATVNLTLANRDLEKLEAEDELVCVGNARASQYRLACDMLKTVFLPSDNPHGNL